MKPVWKRILCTTLMLCLLLSTAPGLAQNASSLRGTIRFSTAYKDSAGMDAMIAAFNEIYPNIKVELKTVGNTEAGNIQVDTMLMADEIDVLSSFTTARTLDRVNSFIDLRELLAKDGLDMEKEWGAEIEFDGGLYGIPFDGLNYFIAINMDAWSEAGLGELPTSWTWDEYLEACRKMTKEGVYGGSDYHLVDAFEFAVRQQLGTDMYFGEDGLTNFLSDPTWKTVIERKIIAENEEKVWKSLVEYNGDGSKSQNLFFQGEIASFVTCNIWRFAVDYENYPHDFQIGFAPYPTQNAGDTAYLAGPSYYAFACITKSCKNVDAAWAFVNFMTMEGNKYLLPAGHLPTWRGTDLGSAIDLIFNSNEEAAKVVDVESFKRVVLNINGASYLDTVTYPEFNSIEKEVIMYIMSGEMSVDEGLQEMKERCDEVIKATR